MEKKLDRSYNCPIATRVAKQIIDRSKIGFKKYGVNVDRNDLSIIDWLQHLQEELLDAAVYLEKLKKEYTVNRDIKAVANSRHKIIKTGQIEKVVSWQIECKDITGEWHDLGIYYGDLKEINKKVWEDTDKLKKELNLLITEFNMEKAI